MLVPVANPQHADAMITLADALVPAEIGRVLMQTIAVAPANWQPADDPAPIERSQAVVCEALQASAKLGIPVEILTTIASHPMEEIARVARLHRCESMLLGLPDISEGREGRQLESLLETLDTNVVVLRSPKGWQLAEAESIDLAAVTGPVGMKEFATFTVNAFITVCTKIITLGLQQIRREPFTAVTIKIRQRRRESRRRDSIAHSQHDRIAPARIRGLQCLIEEIIQYQVFQLWIGIKRGFDVSKKLASDNTTTSPHQRNFAIIQCPAQLLCGLAHQHETLRIGNYF